MKTSHDLYSDEADELVDLDAVDRHQRSFMYHAIKTGRLIALLLVVMLVTGAHWLIWPIAFLGFKLAKHAVRTSQGRRLGQSCFLHPLGD